MNKDETTIKEIHQLEIDLLIQFQNICKKYHLRYFAIGGTCIGAVRHKGFIPWDDDIDVGMPYKDYAFFRNVAKEELKEPYTVYDVNEHRHCSHVFLKIQNEATTFIEETCRQYSDRYTGVFLDIMPLFGLPNNMKKNEKRIINKYKYYLRCNRVLRFPFCDQKTLKGKCFWISQAYKKIFFSYWYYTKKIEKTFGETPLNIGEKILFGWRDNLNRLIFDYEDFKDIIEVPFENITIFIPIGYDSYLKKDFGDYMKIPPKEERVTIHPTAVLDLNNSYKKYIF